MDRQINRKIKRQKDRQIEKKIVRKMDKWKQK